MKKSDYEKLPKEKEFKTLVEISQEITEGGKMPVGSFGDGDAHKAEVRIQKKRTKQICRELFEK